MDRYDPFDSMDRMFDQFRRSMFDAGTMGRPMALPAGDDELAIYGDDEFGLGQFGFETHVRLEQTDDGYVAIADLPGFERDEIDVRYHEGRLSIAAVHEASEEDEMSVRRHTRRVSESVRVPMDLDEDAIAATYRNGVLEVHLPTLETIEDEGIEIDIE